MNIKEKKERISDVMAIYIVAPTEENFKLIKGDIDKRIFDNYYINFVNKSDDETLRSFFSDLIKTDNYNRIYKITVNPIGFLLYHPQVFSLGIPDTYQFLNSPNVQETDIAKYFDRVGTGLYNVLYTLRSLPIIKYRADSFSKEIVDIIQNNFEATFNKFPELKEEFPRKNNTLLLILDRDTDLPIMLHHASSLGSMMNDIFGLSRSKAKGEKFEIDPLTDYIWNSYLSSTFVEANEKIVQDLQAITDQTNFLDQHKNNPDDIDLISEKISSTLEGLRDITIKQGVLNNHMTFQNKLAAEIDKRKLGIFYEFEEKLLSKRVITKELKKSFFDIITLKSLTIKDIGEKNKIDILRLCLIYYIVNTKITQDEVNEIEKALKNIGANLAAFNYIQSKRNFEESLKRGNNTQDTGFLQKSFSFVVNRLGSLMTTEQSSVVADLANSLLSNKEVPNFVTYNLLKKSLDKGNYNFSQVIIFIIGGGSLSEYEFIDDLLKKNNKSVNII
jgi:hypothetical protein